MSNKSTGTAFEREFAHMLSENGFWAHCLKDNSNGQPFDVIAARNGATYVFDCKDCQGKVFSLSRIEENQHNAMTLWRETGNREGIFSIKINRKVYLVTYAELMYFHDAKGTLSATEHVINEIGCSFERWIERQGKLDMVEYLSKKGREIRGIS